MLLADSELAVVRIKSMDVEVRIAVSLGRVLPISKASKLVLLLFTRLRLLDVQVLALDLLLDRRTEQLVDFIRRTVLIDFTLKIVLAIWCPISLVRSDIVLDFLFFWV